MRSLRALIFSTCLCAATWPRNPSLEQLQEAIAARGIDRVASELNRQENPDPWEAIEAHVATGASGWLKVALQLRAHTDGGVSLGLENAVAEALPRNPTGVLDILGSDQTKEFTIQRVCSTETFIETPVSKLRKHLEQSKTALEHVTEARLEKAREACLTVVNNDLNRMRASPK